MEALLPRPPMPGDVLEAGGFRLMAGEIRDGHIRRVRGEPLPTHLEDEDRPDPAEQTEPKAE
jgi:hypothetical protein